MNDYKLLLTAETDVHVDVDILNVMLLRHIRDFTLLKGISVRLALDSIP